MTLRFLLGMRAALTFAAGVVLVIAPALIPGAVASISSHQPTSCATSWPRQNSVWLCCRGQGRTITDAKAVRSIVLALSVLHATPGLLEIWAFLSGTVNSRVLANAFFRAVGCCRALVFWLSRAFDARALISVPLYRSTGCPFTVWRQRAPVVTAMG
jgi:hypothetical protein